MKEVGEGLVYLCGEYTVKELKEIIAAYEKKQASLKSDMAKAKGESNE